MAFVSVTFLLLVAVTALLYFIFPLKHRWVVLLAASYLYFWCNSQWLLAVLFASTAVAFGLGLIIHRILARSEQYLALHKAELSLKARKAHKEKAKKRARRVLLLGTALLLGTLLVLKYSGFFANMANSLLNRFGIAFTAPTFLLPLGISFYTLQAIAYLIDVYRSKCEACRHFGKFMLYMSFFPQIVQGPIPKYSQLAPQLFAGHRFDYDRVTSGMQLVLWGFLKKLIIADRIAIPTNAIFDNYQNYHGIMILLGAVLYGFQVYTDFSGGMDIARGVSEIFGIALSVNFRQPYVSRSIEEFWRRWHITLGAWMREYIFYPLSLSKFFGKLSKLSRKLFGAFFGKRLPAFLAMFIVYFLVGFWHGPSWKYIAYGVWNGIFIVPGILLEKVYAALHKRLRISQNSFCWRLFQILRTFLLVSMGRFFSRALSLRSALGMFGRMFTQPLDFSPLVNGSLTQLGLNTANWVVLIVAVTVLLYTDHLHEKGVSIRQRIARQNILFRWLIYYGAILLLLIFGMYGPGFDSASFIYAQF